MNPARMLKLACSMLLAFIGFLASPLWAQEKVELQKLVTVWAGMLPIILAAPHGGRQPIPGIQARRGIGVAQFTTERDSNTDELAQQIATHLLQKLGLRPFLIVAQFERKYVDANRPRGGAYESAAAQGYYDSYHNELERACAQVRRDWGWGLLLDIHGQGAEGETIFRGTDNGKSVTDLNARFGRDALTGDKSILGQLGSRGYRIVPERASDDVERRYTGGYTTRTYGSHRGTGIDAIQLEFGTNLRARPNLERTATDLANAILVFARAYLPVKDLPSGANSQP